MKPPLREDLLESFCVVEFMRREVVESLWRSPPYINIYFLPWVIEPYLPYNFLSF